MAEKQKWHRERWLEAMWDSDAMTPNRWAVAYVLAHYAGRKVESWASYPEIMRRTGMRSRRTVSQTLQGLVKEGWLSVAAAARGEYSTVYSLTCPLGQQSQIATADPADDRADDNQADGSAVAICTPAVAILHASSSNPGTPDLLELPKEISDIASRGGASLRSPPPTKKASRAIREATARRQRSIAAKIITDDMGIDDETAAGLVNYIVATRKPTEVVALVRHLADSHALEPIYNGEYADSLDF